MSDNGQKKPVLEVSNISKSFGAIEAVRGVSFDVYPGEILGVIGPNGCGKSTLFNCILGQLKPDTGTVTLKGHDVTGRSPVKLAKDGLGRTFQLLQVFNSMTVPDNLLTATQAHIGTVFNRLFKRPDLGLRNEVNHVIEQFRLGHLTREEAGSLSYGQQKLLDMAMGLMSGPQIVFLDEPAGGVNLSMLADVKDRLLELNNEGITFAVIEHNMEFIFEVAHRILVMAEGQVLMLGSAGEVRQDPKVIEAYLGN
ncbi:MAG TPA: ABC transporter ATP-binding protein [Anaerolineae bacterium]|jgi:branched-chain amino acid transport system ATP-binding protein